MAQAAAAGSPTHVGLASAVQRALDLVAAAEGSCARLQQQVVDSAGEAALLADQVRQLQRDDATLRRRLDKARKHASEPAGDSSDHTTRRDATTNTEAVTTLSATTAPTTTTSQVATTTYPGGSGTNTSAYIRAVSETSGLADAATWERRCRELQERCTAAETQLQTLQQQDEPELASKVCVRVRVCVCIYVSVLGCFIYKFKYSLILIRIVHCQQNLSERALKERVSTTWCSSRLPKGVTCGPG